jgi:diaminopimelate epimerase
MAKSLLKFSKYSGNGNDFIIVEEQGVELSAELIQKLCHRQFGVGADGVLKLEASKNLDGRMRIFNADGGEAEMCGNGLRCLATYIDDHATLKKSTYHIQTMNNVYQIHKTDLGMQIEMNEIRDKNAIDLSEFKDFKKSFFINTGVPHLVFLVPDAQSIYIKNTAPFYRFHPKFKSGTNVSFIEVKNTQSQEAYVRTYERGVEDETFSCGTGLTASALALKEWFGWSGKIMLKTKGGDQFVSVGDKVLYSGEVKFVFRGEFNL